MARGITLTFTDGTEQTFPNVDILIGRGYGLLCQLTSISGCFIGPTHLHVYNIGGVMKIFAPYYAFFLNGERVSGDETKGRPLPSGSIIRFPKESDRNVPSDVGFSVTF